MMYSEAIELQPESAVLYCNRSMAYLKQDMTHEALADAEKSLEIDDKVENIKAYWRKAQALLELDRLEESEATADTGLVMQGQAGNQHLNRVRRRARELATMKRLCGDPWSVKMDNGIEKRYAFETDGTLKIHVFGQYVPATFDLSVEGNPRSMVVKMKPEGVGIGNGPPPPPRPYIFEFHDNDQELWLCTPVSSDELPTKFEGQGFDRLRRVAPEAPEVEDASDAEPLDVRCARYIRAMNKAMPLLPPQLPETPSEQEMSKEVLVMEKMSQLRRKYGTKVHMRALELAISPSSAESAELAEVALELQKRFVTRRILPPPAPEPEVQHADVLASSPTPELASAAPGEVQKSRPLFACFAGICGGSS